MMVMVLKFTHLMAMLIAIGLLCFSYVHCCLAVTSDQRKEYRLMRCMHYYFDSAQFFLWVLVVICGVFLVHPKGYNMETPWIRAAIGLVFAMLFFWMASLLCKYRVLSSIIKQQVKRIHLWASYHMAHFAILVLAVIIAHDAVTKSTWFKGF